MRTSAPRSERTVDRLVRRTDGRRGGGGRWRELQVRGGGKDQARQRRGGGGGRSREIGILFRVFLPPLSLFSKNLSGRPGSILPRLPLSLPLFSRRYTDARATWGEEGVSGRGGGGGGGGGCPPPSSLPPTPILPTAPSSKCTVAWLEFFPLFCHAGRDSPSPSAGSSSSASSASTTHRCCWV